MKQTKHSRKSEAQNLCSKCLGVFVNSRPGWLVPRRCG